MTAKARRAAKSGHRAAAARRGPLQAKCSRDGSGGARKRTFSRLEASRTCCQRLAKGFTPEPQPPPRHCRRLLCAEVQWRPPPTRSGSARFGRPATEVKLYEHTAILNVTAIYNRLIDRHTEGRIMGETQDLQAGGQDGEQPGRRTRGRPRKHADRQAASRAASAAYRERRRARRQSPTISSKVIDLSALPAYKVKR